MDKTSDKIPESFENWISDWLKENVISDPQDWETHNAKVVWARAIAYDIYSHVAGQLTERSALPTPIEGEKMYNRSDVMAIAKETWRVGRQQPEIFARDWGFNKWFNEHYPAPPIEQKMEEKPKITQQYLEFKSAGHQKSRDYFTIRMEDENGKSYVTEFNGKFGRLLFDGELIRKAAKVRKMLEMLVEGWSDDWSDYIRAEVEEVIKQAKTWTEPPRHDNAGEEGHVPQEIMGFINAKCDELTDKFGKMIGVTEETIYAYRYGAKAAAISCYHETRETIATLTQERDEYQRRLHNVTKFIIDNTTE